jgi:serralysin
MMAGSVAITRPTDPYLRAFVTSVRWDSLNLTYSFTDSNTDYTQPYTTDNEPASGFQQLNPAQQTAAQATFAMLSALTNLTFTNQTGASDNTADIRMAMSTKPPTAQAYFPGTGPGGDAWFNTTNYNTPQIGNYAWSTFLHELGHSMGLDHPHDNGMPADRDSLEFTVMTYRSFVGGPPTYTAQNFPQTFMMYDIAALQYMYGANFTTNSGNTTYRWDPNSGETFINNVGQGVPATNSVFLTVWDGGGTDTYDFSLYNGVTVSLEPGAWSTTAQNQLAQLGFGPNVFARGNVFNSLLYNGDLRSMIENVTGSPGNDTIHGNGINNTLVGGAGNDTLYGHGGTDTIVGEGGTDIIYGGENTDYIDGRNDNDLIFGENGDDVIFGDGLTTTYGAASDLIYGGDGNDTIMGESGDHATGIGFQDQLYGGTGNDTIFGGAGTDWLFGNEGNDVMEGGLGSDLMVGGQGAEIMLGSGTSIYAAASTGGDLFVYQSLVDGGDQIYGFDFNGATGTDGIDLRTIYDSFGYTGTNARADGYLYVFQNGANIDIYVDANGLAGGANLSLMASLVNANAPATSLTDSFFLFQ